MSGLSIVAMIAMGGWLVLALSAYRAHRVGAKQTIVMGLVWAALFLLVAGVFAAVGS